jgi:photosystem II stability/assembly factor-like uncharacterized protein
MKKEPRQMQRQARSGQRRYRAIGYGLLTMLAVGLVVALGLMLQTNKKTFFVQAQGGPEGAISQLRTTDIHALAFSATEPNTAFFGHHFGLLVSRDGGKSWQETSLKNADAMALALPPSEPKTLYAAGHDVFFKSLDGGKRWQAVPANLPSLDIHGFASDPQNASVVYAHSVGYGVFSSQDGGTTWQPLWLEAPPSVFNLAVGSEDTLYAAAGGEGLWRSDDKGQNWQKLTRPDEAVIAVSFEPSRGRLFATFFGSESGLYVSEDKGASWSLLRSGNFLAFAASPLNPDELMLVDTQGFVFASHDNGLTW